MSESWFDSLRFSLCAVLAASLFALAILSPLAVRNEMIKQLCREKQLELIDLEAENNRRELFVRRIEKMPELLEQLSRQQEASSENEPTEQKIDLPESLAIHPDHMLTLPVSVSSKQAEREKNRSHSQTFQLQLAAKIATSPTLQNRLLIASVFLLLLGIIPASWFHWRFFRRKASLVIKRLVCRYRKDDSHSDFPPPHWNQPASNNCRTGQAHQTEKC